MREEQLSPLTRHKTISLQLLDELFSGQSTADVGIRLWDGTLWPDDHPRAATFVLNHPGALRAMLFPGKEVNLAEAYLHNDFDVEGDIERVYALADGLVETSTNLLAKLRLGSLLLQLPSGDKHRPGERGPAQLSGEIHTIDRDRKAVT